MPKRASPSCPPTTPSATSRTPCCAWRQQGWNERAQLINQIHDALMFQIPDSLMDEAIPAIKAEMERKSEVLIDPVVAPDGLWIETSVSVGRDWSAMEELDVKTGWAKKAA